MGLRVPPARLNVAVPAEESPPATARVPPELRLSVPVPPAAARTRPALAVTVPPLAMVSVPEPMTPTSSSPLAMSWEPMPLTVAVPMYLFYLYFLGRAKRLIHRIERAGIEMVHLIADAREEEEFAPFRGEVTHGKKQTKSPKEPAK